MAEQNNTPKRTRRQQQPVDNTYAHVQPQANEIERAVLGALMIDKDAYAVVTLLFNSSLLLICVTCCPLTRGGAVN